jgi:23S rRNA (guanosine2251-2'-O)-methyltransferase
MPISVFGFHAIEEILKRGRVKGSLYLLPDKKKTDALRSLAREKNVPLVLTDDIELTRLAGNADHRGAVLVLDEIPIEYRNNLSFLIKNITARHALVLLLDGITDPHNFGAILRTADQFNADFIVVTERRSAHETQTVVKTSAGASSYVKIVTISNLHHAIEELKKHEFWVYGAEQEGKPVHSLSLDGRVGIVFGSEGKGLRHLVRESCDGMVSIPAKGNVDSFNVSVAAGIIMYEVRRQQGF